MTDSNYSNVNDGLQEYDDYLSAEAEQLTDELQQQLDATENAQAQLQQEERVALDQQEDPRNAENWGAKALIKEGQSILSGGLQDTASSIATFPERTMDALSGEMQQQREETGTYRPDWSPLVHTIIQ